MVGDFLAAYDGPSGLTLTNPKWYALRPQATQILFRFLSYDELKEYVLVFFSGVKYHTPKAIIENGKLKVEPCSPTDFEQIILVKHFLHACVGRSG